MDAEVTPEERALREAEARGRSQVLRWLASLLTQDWHPSPQERVWLRAQAEEDKHGE